MKIAFTGPKSYVGEWLKSYHNAIPVWADIRNRNDLKEQLVSIKPDILVHLAAKTDVDYCESHTKECESVNLWGTSNVADLCSNLNILVVMLSTFQVFSGKKWIGGYSEKDNPNPINYYGMSKLAAEAVTKTYSNMKIVRTGYLFDSYRLWGRIEKLREDENTQSYPTFQKRSFMHVKDFCDSLVNYYLPNFSVLPHVLHISGSENVSWYEFMKSVSVELETQFSPSPRKKELEGMIPRPHNGGLNNNLSYKLGFPKVSFRDSLRLMK